MLLLPSHRPWNCSSALTCTDMHWHALPTTVTVTATATVTGVDGWFRRMSISSSQRERELLWFWRHSCSTSTAEVDGVGHSSHPNDQEPTVPVEPTSICNSWCTGGYGMMFYCPPYSVLLVISRSTLQVRTDFRQDDRYPSSYPVNAPFISFIPCCTHI